MDCPQVIKNIHKLMTKISLSNVILAAALSLCCAAVTASSGLLFWPSALLTGLEVALRLGMQLNWGQSVSSSLRMQLVPSKLYPSAQYSRIGRIRPLPRTHLKNTVQSPGFGNCPTWSQSLTGSSALEMWSTNFGMICQEIRRNCCGWMNEFAFVYLIALC